MTTYDGIRGPESFNLTPQVKCQILKQDLSVSNIFKHVWPSMNMKPNIIASDASLCHNNDQNIT